MDWFVRRARADTRGASLVEYVMLVGLVALVAAAGLRAFGNNVRSKITCMAAALVGAGAGCEGEGTASASAAVTAGPGKTNPKFEKLEGGKGATYQTVDGNPFQTGEGDPTAVHPNDLDQGAIADCYFISSMGSVAARDPGAIQELIEANDDGTFTVTFYEPNDHSWWQFWESNFKAVKITVKPDFPVKDGNPVFAQPGDEVSGKAELWPMILEKAYAQYKGGYSEIEYDFPDESMQLLTGEKSERMPADLTFDQFYDHWRDGDAVTGWTTPEDKAKDNPLFREDGPLATPLVSNHVYYVTGSDPEAKTVTLENPWGWGSGELTLTWEQYRSAFVGTTTNRID